MKRNITINESENALHSERMRELLAPYNEIATVTPSQLASNANENTLALLAEAIDQSAERSC